MTTKVAEEKSLPTLVEIRYVGSTDAIYTDSPLGTALRLSPNQTISIPAVHLNWFLAKNKEYTSCCGASGTHIRKRFEVV